MRSITLLAASSLSAFAVTAGAAGLPATVSDTTGALLKAPISLLIRVADKTGLSDGEIAYLYIQANLFEVEIAKLGTAQGTAPDVREHGAMVAKDHGSVVKMFEEVLLKTGVKPVADAGSAQRVAEQDKFVAALKAKSGADFDKAYIAHAVANHRAVIKTLRETLIPATSNAQIVAHFNTVLPAFENHLAMTLEAAKALGVSDSRQ